MKPDDPVSQGAARAIEHLNDDHDERIDGPGGLRKATVKLARKARAELGMEQPGLGE